MPEPRRLSRGPQLPYKVLCGVEPVPHGWLIVSAKLQGINMFPEPPQVMRSFIEILDYVPPFEVVAVHIPIGLPSDWIAGGRLCDRLARHLLGSRRGAAIMSPPPRSALADPAGRGLSAIGRSLLPKIREVHENVASYHQRTVFEVHPELGFYQLNADTPLGSGKHTRAGLEERISLLAERINGFDRIVDYRPAGVRIETLLDAAVDVWTARRIAARAVARLPEAPEWNEDGLRMELVR